MILYFLFFVFFLLYKCFYLFDTCKTLKMFEDFFFLNKSRKPSCEVTFGSVCIASCHYHHLASMYRRRWGISYLNSDKRWLFGKTLRFLWRRSDYYDGGLKCHWRGPNAISEFKNVWLILMFRWVHVAPSICGNPSHVVSQTAAAQVQFKVTGWVRALKLFLLRICSGSNRWTRSVQTWRKPTQTNFLLWGHGTNYFTA